MNWVILAQKMAFLGTNPTPSAKTISTMLTMALLDFQFFTESKEE
jgi:hypothetical protein